MKQESPQPMNNFKADFEKSPNEQSNNGAKIELKENNLWNDRFVKVVN